MPHSGITNAMSIDSDHQKPAEVFYEHACSRSADSTTDLPESQDRSVPRTLDDLAVRVQTSSQNLTTIQNPSDKIEVAVHPTVFINNDSVAVGATDTSPYVVDISKSNVLALPTPIISIASSDVSFDDAMSTRSSSSTVPTETTEPSTSDDKVEEGPKEAELYVSEISGKILNVILEYSLDKFDTTAELHTAGRPKFMAVISRFVRTRQKVVMCLPAFPFKSANKVEKVLGSLPDKAEELALGRLNTMCATIAQFYEPGAELTIISDGLVYNDLLGISDQDTWRYGQALRAMADQKAFSHLAFSRLQDIVSVKNLPDELVELSYVANATNFRRTLLSAHGRDGDVDVDHEIANNPDTLMTYRGYCRFLESDLQYIFGCAPKGRVRAYKRDVKYLAKQMIMRGFAFAGAVKARFPNHLRLSIHQSTGEHKISLSLLHTKTGFTTPWHCSVALMADGEWISALRSDFDADRLMELVEEDGRPSYFREAARQRPYLRNARLQKTTLVV